MSIQGFTERNPGILKTLHPGDFFEQFKNKDFELGIEIMHKSGQMELQFMTVKSSEVVLFCAMFSIKTITYFGDKGDPHIHIVKLSMI